MYKKWYRKNLSPFVLNTKGDKYFLNNIFSYVKYVIQKNISPFVLNTKGDRKTSNYNLIYNVNNNKIKQIL